MMSIRDFYEFKYDSYKASELANSGLSTLLSLPTVTGFVAYGITFGALTFTPYISLSSTAFVTPVFVASLIGGTLGLLAGAFAVLVLLPAMAIGLRMLIDCTINGDFSLQHLFVIAECTAINEIKKFHEIFQLLKDLDQRDIFDFDQEKILGDQSALTDTQKEIFAHIAKLDANFTSGEADFRYQQNQRILDLQNARCKEWFAAERASRYRALYVVENNKTDDRLALLGTNPGFHLLDLVYYVYSTYDTSFDYRMHPSHAKLNFIAISQLQNNVLYLKFAEDPIKLLLNMTIDELQQLKRDIIAKDARYRAMSPRSVTASLELLTTKTEGMPKDFQLATEHRYCDVIANQTMTWAKHTSDTQKVSIQAMDEAALGRHLAYLQESAKTAAPIDKININFQVKRVENMIAEFNKNDNDFTFSCG